MTPTPEEAVIRLINNFTRDAKTLLAAIHTEQISSKESPFTDSDDPDKLASTTNNGGTPNVGTK